MVFAGERARGSICFASRAGDGCSGGRWWSCSMGNVILDVFIFGMIGR